MLRDGSTVHVRETHAEDEPRLRAFFAALSDEARWFRFFSGGGGPRLGGAQRRRPRQRALPARAAAAPRARSSARHLHRRGARPGEVAFAVADAWHGQGIATILLAHLAAGRVRRGHRRSPATVLPSNHRMLEVLRDSGFPVVARRAGRDRVEFPTSLSREARRRFEQRQRTAAVAAVAHVLRPASIAVIGASRRPGPSAARSCTTCSPAASRDRCTRSTRAAARSPAGLPSGRSPTSRARRARGHRRARGRGARGRARVRRQGRARARRADRRLRRDRPRGPRAPGELLARLPRRRDAPGRPQLPRRRQHRSPTSGSTRRSRPGRPPPGQRRLRVAERGVRDRRDRRGGGARARALGVRLDGQQGRPLGQRLPRVLGAGPDTVVCCSTSSRSATRAGSGGSPAGSRGASRSSRSRAGAPRPARAASSHTGALLAASDVTVDALFRHAGVIRTDTLERCSTSRRCSRASRCRAATAWPS